MAFSLTQDVINGDQVISIQDANGVLIDRYHSPHKRKINRILDQWKKDYSIIVPGTVPLAPVSGMTHWLKADKDSYSDTAFTTTQKTIGGTVKGLKDQSGFGKHVTSAQSSITYQEPILFNRAAIRGDGTSSNLRTVDGALGSVTAFTMVIAGRYRALTGISSYIWGAAQTAFYNAGDGFALIGMINVSGWKYRASIQHPSVAAIEVMGPLYDFRPHIWTIQWSMGGVLEFFIDGVSVGSIADPTNSPMNFAKQCEYLSMAGGTFLFSIFDLYEAIFYPTRLSPTALTTTHAAITDDWGLTPYTSQLAYSGVFCTAESVRSDPDYIQMLISDGSDDGASDCKLYSQYYRISTNTASTPVLTFSDPIDGLNTGVHNLLKDSRGTLHGAYYSYHNATGTFQSYHCTSTGTGKPWTTTAMKRPAAYSTMAVSGTMREVSPGRFLLPCFGKNIASTFSENFVMQSLDYGANWTLLGVINIGDATHSWSETDIIQISGNMWMAIYRRDAPLQLWKSISLDYCSTWINGAQFGTDPGGTPSLTRLADSLLVLTYSHSSDDSGLIARTCKDDGTTWGELIRIMPGTNHMDNQYIMELAPRKLALIRPGIANDHNIFIDIFGEGLLQQNY